MIVLDASVVVELLLGTAVGHEIGAALADPALALHAPHLLDIEVAQVLRRYLREGELDAEVARRALDDLRDLDIERHAHEPLVERIWALRDNLSAYDAAYVALAEALGASVWTCDARLARAPGLAKRMHLVRA